MGIPPFFDRPSLPGSSTCAVAACVAQGIRRLLARQAVDVLLDKPQWTTKKMQGRIRPPSGFRQS
ncbi:MAG: hypothetical protein ACYCYD_11945 [Acidimicrobiales bacterium]